jgi:hypothetical protein
MRNSDTGKKCVSDSISIKKFGYIGSHRSKYEGGIGRYGEISEDDMMAEIRARGPIPCSVRADALGKFEEKPLHDVSGGSQIL